MTLHSYNMTTVEAIKIINDFRLLIINMKNGQVNRSAINRAIPQVKKLVSSLGTSKKMNIAPPPMFGGCVLKNVDPLDMIFRNPYGMQYDILSTIVDMMDESLGVMESNPDVIEEVEGKNHMKETAKDNNCGGDFHKVFIVHGRDNELKEAVARFIEKMGFEPIILHEQVNCGKTIIEKFEKNSDVGYAIVLMTPDDMGGVDDQRLMKRARQNVLFELGYFHGKLGRNRVTTLVKGELEIPSDIFGVVYTEVDSKGYWKVEIAKEMKACGYAIDMNNLYK